MNILVSLIPQLGIGARRNCFPIDRMDVATPGKKIMWTKENNGYRICLSCGKSAQSKPIDCREIKHQERYLRNKARYDYHSERIRHLKRTYGIDEKFFDDRLLLQENKCAICLTELKENIYIDHDHKTGKFRGLLCPGCNIFLGQLEKLGYDGIKRAEAYLKWHEELKIML